MDQWGFRLSFNFDMMALGCMMFRRGWLTVPICYANFLALGLCGISWRMNTGLQILYHILDGFLPCTPTILLSGSVQEEIASDTFIDTCIVCMATEQCISFSVCLFFFHHGLL